MSERKLVQASQSLWRQVQKIARGLTRSLVLWLLRTAFVGQRRFRSASGFVLPTTILLLLVVSLTVGAMVFRAYNYTNLVMGSSQQRVIYNAATPAIDRARAKLENLFDSNRDNRYPGGIPSENYLTGMLRNDGSYSVAALPGAPTADLYTLPDETRINLDGQTKTSESRGEDNAWAFRTDTNGDGVNDATVVYTVLMQTPPDLTTGTPAQSVAGSGLVSTNDRTKANSLWVRTAPLSNRQRGNCSVQSTQVSSAAQGWFQDLNNSAILRKNFQIDALVIPDNARNRNSFVTLEMQQDRQLDRGNKWGAWFRYDLEIFPGPQFNWNGAMHTEGNLMIQPGTGFDAYLVSAQNSCLMSSPTSSEITVTNISNPTNASTLKPDFIGAAMSASMRDNNYGGSSNIHIWPAGTAAPSQVVTLDTGNDSSNQSATPANMALDPVALLTRDVSLARGSNPSNRSNVVSPWVGLPSSGRTPRITNQQEPKPYVDDLYRADDRWGPKPRYTDLIVLNGAAQQPGNLITSTNVTSASDLNSLVNNTAPTTDPANVGLDGYWERRARNEGLRIIVGQRLELGNTAGWSNNDPLYPPNVAISHQARQRRTLRDNLAAVQSTAIYHASNPGGLDFPVACLASTTHPGTATTLQNSIDFRTANRTFYNAAGTALPLRSDFLNGYGTNGWEYAPPQGTEASFATAIASNQPLGRALRNLANFAGDPAGAFPPLQEANIPHPYPNLTMWGNFSELRRVLARLDSGATYASLSPAGKTTLHTASCMLGMLAYNVDIAQNSSLTGTINGTSITTGQKVSLGMAIWQNFEGFGQKPDLYQQYCTSGNGTESNPYRCDILPTISPSKADPLLADLSDNQFALAIQVLNQTQIQRDRTYGFKQSQLVASNNTFDVKGSGNDWYRFRFPANCDPNSGSTSNPLNVIAPDGQGLDQKKAGLAMLCASKPKYPALFYIFPRENHDQDGDKAKTTINDNQGNDQPTSEPYISDTPNGASNIAVNSYIYRNTVNGSVQYQVVGSGPDDLSGVIIQPRGANFSDWLLPNQAQTNIANANVSPNLIEAPDGTARAVGFLDRALFNGREMMTARVLDVDLGMLRSRGSTGTNNQPWLPIGGIVYAFREDAVREDAIARPPGGLAPTQTSITGNNVGTDPTLFTTAEGIQISTKPVDYVPDPERRPHGFRLRNGVQLKRNASFNIPAADNIRGLSFISDDPVYIQGNFNLHQTGNDDTVGTRIEEFNEPLVPGLGAGGLYTQSQFYGRTNRNANFAQPANDRWRPSEILADGITILSDNFCPGSIEDTFTSAGGNSVTASVYHNPALGLWAPGCANASRTSFLNQNRPQTSSTWMRQIAWDPTSPIESDRNGRPLLANGNTYSGNYDAFNTDKPLMSAADTTINSIIVSSLVPSRAQQSYGGLHNFPRFLENWGGRNLWINGSFMQLNFSNYATAPFDQDAWEPGASVSSSEFIQYYSPPNRIWGYDPALQLAPAGPAAARFITTNRNRNEFYTEVPGNDPYINRLCTAFNGLTKTGILAGAPTSVTCP